MVSISAQTLLLSKVKSRLLQPFSFSEDFPADTGSHVLCTETQDWDTQNDLIFSLPGQGFVCVDFLSFFPFFFFFFSRSFPGAQIPTQILFFPSYSIKWSSFLQLWLYRSSVSFQLVFCENCPTFWCLLGKQSYMSTYSNILIRPSFSFLVFHSTVKVPAKPGWDFKQYFEKPEGGTNF